MQALKFGIVSEAKPGYAKVYFQDDDFVTSWWPVLVRTSMTDKESWPLNVKEHVACICGEHCEEGVVLGAIHSNPEPPDSGAGPGKFRRLFSDGTLIEYDKGAGKLTANVVGEVDVTASTKIKATAPDIEISASASAKVTAPNIQIDGNATVSGALVVAGAITGATIATTGGGAITSTGDITTSGTIQGSSVKAGAIDLGSHKHSGVQTGGGLTGIPV